MPSVDARLSRGQRWTLTVSCLAIGIVVGAMAALYTALPDIAVETGATQRELTWIVDAYTLALACLVLPAGALGDRYGRRKAMVGGLVLFTIASALPVVAHDPRALIAARALAGVGAAFVMPSTLSIMTASFAPEQRGRAVGIWAGLAGSGAVLGIIAAGLVTERYSWTTIFVGFAVASLLLLGASVTVPETRDDAPPPMDPFGAAWVAAAIGGVVFGVVEGPERGWGDPLVLALLGGGVVCATVFVVVELRSQHPLLPIRLFALRGFGSGALSITIQFLVSFGVFLVLVQYLQLILGYGPITAALAMAPMIGPLVVMSIFTPWLADRVGLKAVTVVGLAIVAFGLVLVSRLTVSADYLDLVVALVIASCGMGFATAPATTAIVADTPVSKHGVAAAVNDVAREIGAAIGIAIAGSVIAAGYTHEIAPVLPHLPESARGPVSDSLASALAVAEQGGPVGAPLAQAAKEAFVHGAGQASLALAAITAAGAVLLAFWAPGRQSSSSSSGGRRLRATKISTPTTTSGPSIASASSQPPA